MQKKQMQKKSRLDRSENTNSESELNTISKGMGSRHHDSHRDFRITFALFQSLRLVGDHIDDSPSISPQEYQTNQEATSHNTQQASIQLLSVQLLYIHRSTFLAWLQNARRFHSPLLALPALQLPGLVRLVRLVRCTQCQSSSFGAELDRPSIRLRVNCWHINTKRFPSRCFVIKSAGLTVPRILSTLSSWFFSFCCSHKYFVSICLIAPLPLQRAHPRAAAASVQIRT